MMISSWERERPGTQRPREATALLKRALRLLALLLVFATASTPDLWATASLAAASDTPDRLYFPETGYAVQGKFLSYWQTNGSVFQFGYPVSSELLEKSDTNSKVYTVQYFERAELELHAEDQPPHDVLLTLLGALQYQKEYPEGAPGQAPNVLSASILFPETGKRLGGRFLDYWQTHGGVAKQGYPVSDEFSETSPLNGKTYKVQYFERAVFEYHPENAGTPYEVLLSQLGRLRYRAMYVAQPPPDIAVLVPPGMSPQALAYLRDALDFTQMNFIGRDKFDWVEIRRGAFEVAQNAQTPADTYGAIQDMLYKLNDLHAALSPPVDNPLLETPPATLGIFANYDSGLITTVMTGSLAEKSEVRAGDVIEQINSRARNSLSASDFFVQLYSGVGVQLKLGRKGEPNPIQVAISHERVDPAFIPQGRRLGGDLGYISLPGTNDHVIDYYASIGQQIIKDLDRTPICGWTVDLQLNHGGSMYPMLLAVGPILGNGELGTFIEPDGHQITWNLQDGHVYLTQDGLYRLVRQVEDPYMLKRSMPPVAVLFDRFTASAGEATLISFKGRPFTRTFGEPSTGVPTSPTGKTLSDNAFIKMSGALEADRTGRVYGYNEKIRPDKLVTELIDPRIVRDLKSIGTESDPVLQASVQWLQNQPGCVK